MPSKKSPQSLDFRVGSRGWCYLLEDYGLQKNDFDKAQDLITEIRKRGHLPLDFIAEDESRVAEGVEHLDNPDSCRYADTLMDNLSNVSST